MAALLAEVAPLLGPTREERKVIPLRPHCEVPTFPKGRPKDWRYCEGWGGGCGHNFGGEKICHTCSNWETLPTG